ncbi:hypothetical protein [Aeoliella sp.]|uniref:hypothetical protein n=1 Tax=Aeoliella sp. TaxID=2795800 RepID=UPI003CCBBF49
MSTAQTSSQIIVDALWKQAHSTVQLPPTMELHSPHAKSPPKIHTALHSFDWYKWQTRCILLCGETLFGILSRDLSRSGIGFYSPIEVRPGETAEVVLPSLRVLKIKSLHSTKLNDVCYECGACFRGNTGASSAPA